MPHVTVMESPPVRTFLRYGLDRPFLRVFEGLLDVASLLPDYRLSELFAGFSESTTKILSLPRGLQPAGPGRRVVVLDAHHRVGDPDGLQGALRIRRPSLPRHINWAVMGNLRVGDARVEAQNRDSAALTDVTVDGQLDVVLEIPRTTGQDGLVVRERSRIL
jgi:hypothetical protein